MLATASYLSSSDSDVPAPVSSKTDKKKTKKKRPPPQDAINKVWREFVAKKPSKALSILPFATVPSPTGLERDNEPLSAGFDRAAAECKSKVEKIIRECRRVNMRYRDPGFDLDWDLRTGTGNCLNSLGATKFDVSSYRWWSIGSSVPKAVKRVHEVFASPTFMSDISSSDIKQGALGDCWFISGLSGLANAPELLKRLCVAYDTRIGIYGFVFYRDGEWVYSIIDDKLYLLSADWDHPSLQRHLLQKIDREDTEQVYRKTYQSGSKALFFAKCKDENETWVPLLEKAYAKCHGDFASLEGGFSGEGLEDLTGGVTTEVFTSDILDLDEFWNDQLVKVNDEFLFSCTTGLLEPGYGQRDGIEEAHAYMCLAARTLTKGDKAGTRMVLLRNPWGATRKGVWEGAFSDGSKEWTPEIQEELGHHFGQDSVFWITYDDLIRKFTQFDRTRLFRDPEWRCCQRFAGCEVPWKPQFEEKFVFKLTKSTQLVLVLSQLDNRYFKGLQGQYDFKVHFRLHEKDQPEPENYIVRSHGNYLMSRSVAVELPDMDPGEYSVFVSVTATRRVKRPTVEEVVKRETKNRSQNDKLSQVGLAYDLAHAKAAKHIQAMTRKRRKALWKRSSEKRRAYRVHEWEYNHRVAKLDKKKIKKDKEKKEQRAAERKKRRDRRQAEADALWEAEEAQRKKKEEEEAEEQRKKEEEKAEEQRKKEEEEAEEQRKKEEAEAAEKKKQEEAEAEERKQKEEQEVAESKKQEEEVTEEKKKNDKAEEEERKKSEAEEKADPQHKGTQVDSREFFEDSDGENAQPTPQGTPQIEKSTFCSREGSVQGDGDQNEKDSGVSKENGEPEKTAEVETGTTGASEGPKTKDQSTQTDPEDESKQENESKQGGSSDGKESKDEDLKDKKSEGVDSKDTSPKEGKKSEPEPGKESDKPSVDKKEESKQGDSTNEKRPETDKADGDKKSDRQPKPEERKPPKVKHSDTEGDSSASPLSDWEELYSSDDYTRKPRREMGKYPALAVTSTATCDKKHVGDDEDDKLPEPWNAICIVGFKVYSKDEGLTLRIVDVEDEEVETNGEIGGAGKLGEKVSNDLDSGVINAAGGLTTEKKKEEGDVEKSNENEKKTDEKEKGKIEEGEEKSTDNSADDKKIDHKETDDPAKTDSLEEKKGKDANDNASDESAQDNSKPDETTEEKTSNADDQSKQEEDGGEKSKDGNKLESTSQAVVNDSEDDVFFTSDERYLTSEEF